MSGPRPTLWQLEISHYSEKARWALDHKRIDHRRRSPMPGNHVAIALWLTRGACQTFPLLEIEGRTVSDSSAVIAALEQHYPERPLYPTDPEQRRRALALEDFFDEELGPYSRLAVFHDLIREPELFAEVAVQTAPAPLNRAKGLVGAYGRAYTSLRFGAGSDAADVTAAALFFPVVAPENGPVPADQPTPAAFETFRDGIRDRPGYVWVEETFRRHRLPAPTA
ncbi:MAG: glutathione S-transferase N-terminal domain-containing protein [Solirubrobacterales bacterium]|nr:glutathione S-transferase N-terminal domain-containing protein [Solirubrobacterales bacterium]